MEIEGRVAGRGAGQRRSTSRRMPRHTVRCTGHGAAGLRLFLPARPLRPRSSTTSIIRAVPICTDRPLKRHIPAYAGTRWHKVGQGGTNERHKVAQSGTKWHKAAQAGTSRRLQPDRRATAGRAPGHRRRPRSRSGPALPEVRRSARCIRRVCPHPPAPCTAPRCGVRPRLNSRGLVRPGQNGHHAPACGPRSVAGVGPRPYDH